VIHTGEIELAGAEARGLALHETARIMAFAGTGEILVSDLTRQLATGAGFTFHDRGDVELRGITGTRHLFELEATSGP
jgi:class 3 adenylate cyclase